MKIKAGILPLMRAGLTSLTLAGAFGAAQGQAAEEAPDWRRFVDLSIDGQTVGADDTNIYTRTLDDIYAVPEGRVLMEQALLSVQNGFMGVDPDKKLVVQVSTDPASITDFEYGYGIYIGQDISDDKYRGVDGGFHEVSLAEAFFHEMAHLVFPDADTPENHHQVIDPTNQFMTSYYETGGRAQHADGSDADLTQRNTGTPGWAWVPMKFNR